MTTSTPLALQVLGRDHTPKEPYVLQLHKRVSETGKQVWVLAQLPASSSSYQQRWPTNSEMRRLAAVGHQGRRQALLQHTPLLPPGP